MTPQPSRAERFAAAMEAAREAQVERLRPHADAIGAAIKALLPEHTFPGRALLALARRDRDELVEKWADEADDHFQAGNMAKARYVNAWAERVATEGV